MASENLKFTVRRQPPVLITPAEPTPYELKPLSDIDDQDGLPILIPVIQFYRNKEASVLDPAKVIKEAIAKALVFYYPFAGRLKEGTGRKLFVECTGEGVLFVEADADVRLDQFGSEPHPPFPCLDELLFNVKGSYAVIGCPLLLIQLTRLVCGGFIFALHLNHTMADGSGLVQFMEAVAQMARGFKHPTIKPVWNRELLTARSPPNPTFVHHEYDNILNTNNTNIIPLDDMVHKYFFFSPDQIANIKKKIPVQLRGNTSTFEVLTACLWRCRTVALRLDTEEEVRVILVVNVRKMMGLPEGYYGNAMVYPAAVVKVEKLVNNPLGYAVELVKKAKKKVNVEYVKSVVDFLVMRGRPHTTIVRSYLVSDATKVGLEDVDFGWGKAAYGGPAITVGSFSGVRSFYVPFKGGILVPVSLPGFAMPKFVEEIEKLTAAAGGVNGMDDESEHPVRVRAIFSAL